MNSRLTRSSPRKQWCSAPSRKAAAKALRREWPRLAEGLTKRAVRGFVGVRSHLFWRSRATLQYEPRAPATSRHARCSALPLVFLCRLSSRRSPHLWGLLIRFYGLHKSLTFLFGQCAHMTKVDLLVLCAHWHLKSDIWQRRGSRGPRVLRRKTAATAATAAAAATAGPHPPANPSAPLCPDSVWALIGSTLRPLSSAAALFMSGERSRAAADDDPLARALFAQEARARGGGGGCGVCSITRLPMLTNVHGKVQAEEMEAAQRAHPQPGDGATPPPRQPPPSPPPQQLLPPPSPAVAAAHTLFSFGRTHFTRSLEATTSRLAEPGLLPAERVWLDEARDAQAASLEARRCSVHCSARSPLPVSSPPTLPRPSIGAACLSFSRPAHARRRSAAGVLARRRGDVGHALRNRHLHAARGACCARSNPTHPHSTLVPSTPHRPDPRVAPPAIY